MALPEFVKKLDGLFDFKNKSKLSLLNKNLAKILPPGKLIEKVYLLVLLVSFGVLAFKPGSIVTEDKVLIIIVAGGGLFLLRSLRRKLYFPQKYALLIGGFFLISIITTIFSVNLYNSILRLTEFFSVGLISLLGYDLIYNKSKRRWILNGLVLVLCGLLIYSIGLAVYQKTALSFPLNFPAYNGILVLSLLPFAIFSALKTKKIKKVLFYISILIFLVAIVFTFNNFIYILGGLEIVAAILINFAGRIKKTKDITIYLPFLIIFVACVLMGVALHLYKFPKNTLSAVSLADRNVSLQLQGDILKQSWGVFTENPLLGSGLDNFKIVALYHQDSPWKISYYINNEIMEIFAGEGLIGGVLFLAIFAYTFYQIFKKDNFSKLFIKKTSEGADLALTIVMIFLGLLYYPVLHVEVILFILFFFIGILMRDLNIDSKKRYYLGDLSNGILSGLCLAFIAGTIYFYYLNLQFVQIRQTLTVATLVKTKPNIERLVQMNPINTQFASFLSQVDLYQQDPKNALKENDIALKYDRKSPYLNYLRGQIYLLSNDTKNATKIQDFLIANAPYADPAFYQIKFQLDSQANLKNDLLFVANKFKLDNNFYMYQQLFTDLGYTDTLSKIYFELGILTRDNSYLKIAQQLNPQGLGVFQK